MITKLRCFCSSTCSSKASCVYNCFCPGSWPINYEKEHTHYLAQVPAPQATKRAFFHWSLDSHWRPWQITNLLHVYASQEHGKSLPINIDKQLHVGCRQCPAEQTDFPKPQNIFRGASFSPISLLYFTVENGSFFFFLNGWETVSVMREDALREKLKAFDCPPPFIVGLGTALGGVDVRYIQEPPVTACTWSSCQQLLCHTWASCCRSWRPVLSLCARTRKCLQSLFAGFHLVPVGGCVRGVFSF